MKNLLLSLLLLLPLCAQAQEPIAQQKPLAYYLRGAVPMQDGLVVFSKDYYVETTPEDKQKLKAWMEQLVAQSIPAPGDYARIIQESDTALVARVCHWLVFKKKFLNLDRTRMRYELSVSFHNGHVSLRVYRINYYYGEDMNTENAEQYKAEEWISDQVAVNPKNTKLYPRSRKFRIHTVDYMDRLFDSARMALGIEQIEATPIIPIPKNLLP